MVGIILAGFGVISVFQVLSSGMIQVEKIASRGAQMPEGRFVSKLFSSHIEDMLDIFLSLKTG